MDKTAEILSEYIRDIICAPDKAALDLETLDEDYIKLGEGLMFLARCFSECNEFAKELAKGNFSAETPPAENVFADSLKSLHANLRHLTWQSKQVAKGDYTQRADFPGDFVDAFNTMVEQLAERQQKLEQSRKSAKTLENHAYRDSMTNLYNRRYGMAALREWVEQKKNFSLAFIDLDNLKYINDAFGHREGDRYITTVADYLKALPPDTVTSRIGGDEFMLLMPSVDYDAARQHLLRLQESMQAEEYLRSKDFTYEASFGIVTVDESNTLTTSQVLHMADERMYEDKRERKRNRQKME